MLSDVLFVYTATQYAQKCLIISSMHEHKIAIKQMFSFLQINRMIDISGNSAAYSTQPHIEYRFSELTLHDVDALRGGEGGRNMFVSTFLGKLYTRTLG